MWRKVILLALAGTSSNNGFEAAGLDFTAWRSDFRGQEILLVPARNDAPPNALQNFRRVRLDIGPMRSCLNIRHAAADYHISSDVSAFEVEIKRKIFVAEIEWMDRGLPAEDFRARIIA